MYTTPNGALHFERLADGSVRVRMNQQQALERNVIVPDPETWVVAELTQDEWSDLLVSLL